MENLALKNATILITRPVAQAVSLTSLVEQHGGKAFLFPTLRIEPLPEALKCKAIDKYQWLIFTSANAVLFLPKKHQRALSVSQNIHVVAIGKATENALKTAGIKVNLMPLKEFNSEGLLALPAFQAEKISGQEILIIRGQGGRELLKKTLIQRGAKVGYRDVYKRIQPVPTNVNALSEQFQQRKISQITMTSGEALHNFILMLKTPIIIALALEIPLVVVSQRLKTIAITLGFKKIFISEHPADSAIIKTVITVCNGENCDRKNS